MSKRDLIAFAVKLGLGEAADLHHAGEHLRNVKTGKQYIAKTGGKQVYGEGRGLQAISSACPSIVPQVYACEESEDAYGGSILISDYISLGRSDRASMQILAEKMANEMHNPAKHTGQRQFGFEVTTHCGDTAQKAGWELVCATLPLYSRLNDSPRPSETIGWSFSATTG